MLLPATPRSGDQACANAYPWLSLLSSKPWLTSATLYPAEKAALHWVPQSQLPALDDDEMLDRLEQAARSGLAAQAKQVQCAHVLLMILNNTSAAAGGGGTP